jgi:serine/threonine-protein kinase HipA
MRKANILQQGIPAGVLQELDGGHWQFDYREGYSGKPVSLTMPISRPRWKFGQFPSAFEGLLPEGVQLEAMLRLCKLDRGDLFGQLVAAGEDLVGSLTVEEIE